MSWLIAAVVVLVFAFYLIIKSARSSADRAKGPDISDPSTAPDSIGDSDEGDGEAGD